MKTQAALFSIFQKFYVEICTQFNTYVRILRSDNAKEYFSTPFSSFMSSYGILHQSSCAYTPQHNGVAEHKNRHLIKTARTLLLHHKVPQRFWGDAILATCYLVNRMSSSVLHYQIPYFALLPNQPLFFLHPRDFGCVCFVHILTHGQDKLSVKAMKCVFLGYSRLQRVIVVILPTLIATLSLLISPFLRIHPSSPLQCVLLFRMSYLFLLSYHLQIPLHLQMS